MPRPDEPNRPHDEADPVRNALEGFNAEEAVDDPNDLEADDTTARPLNPDSPQPVGDDAPEQP